MLTEDDFAHRSRYLSLRDTLNRLLELGCIPVINRTTPFHQRAARL
jgi:glutamate 5-kinase